MREKDEEFDWSGPPEPRRRLSRAQMCRPPFSAPLTTPPLDLELTRPPFGERLEGGCILYRLTRRPRR